MKEVEKNKDMDKKYRKEKTNKHCTKFSDTS